MSEKATTRTLMAAIPEQCPQRIESRGTGPGIPDIWCGDCAIETKCLKQYPKKPTSPVTLDHPLTIAQYRWLINRWRSGFKAFVVLQVGRKDWYLFAAPDAYVLVPSYEVSQPQLKKQVIIWTNGGIDEITRPNPILPSLGEYLKMSIERINQLREEAGLSARWKDI